MSRLKKKNSFYLLFITCLISIFIAMPIPAVNAQTPAEIREECLKKYPPVAVSYTAAVEPPGVYLMREQCFTEGMKKATGASVRESQNSPADMQNRSANPMQKSNDKKEVQKSKIVPKQSSRPVISDGE